MLSEKFYYLLCEPFLLLMLNLSLGLSFDGRVSLTVSRITIIALQQKLIDSNFVDTKKLKNKCKFSQEYR